MFNFVILALSVVGIVTMVVGYIKYPPMTEWSQAIKDHDRPEEKKFIARQDQIRQNIMFVGFILLMIGLAIGVSHT